MSHSAADGPATVADSFPPRPVPLTRGVRDRVVALAADALGGLSPDQIPGPLRPFARFTPTRRARLAAVPLAVALEGDDAFRDRVGERVRAVLPELAAGLESGSVPAAADPLDVAALAYLTRPAGWDQLVAEAGDRAAAEDAVFEVSRLRQDNQRLTQQLTEARGQLKAEIDRHRGEVDVFRAELEEVRRQSRQAQHAARRHEADLRRAEAELSRTRGEAAAAAQRAESDSRRLRARLVQAQEALEAGRKAARAGRSLDDVRVRLLLDTVVEAAQGLQRELALPPLPAGSVRPADTVEAARPQAAGPLDLSRQARTADDPVLLDQLLAMPQAHLVVDGYNVTKSGYPALPLSEQRARLLTGLGALAAQSGAEVTCVFDGADLAEPALVAAPRGVRVRFSRQGETADEVIRRLVRAEPTGRALVVVSSDREVMEGVRRFGARPVPAAMLLRRLGRG